MRILFVGRLHAEKGVFVAIDAMRSIESKQRCLLTVAGDGPAALQVRARAQRADVAGRVTVVGHLDPVRLAETYRNSDIFVFPTTWPEGFPTVLSEAMAAGLPIVTTRTRGSADHLEDGRHALFVPPNDPNAVARAVERLIEDEDSRCTDVSGQQGESPGVRPGPRRGPLPRRLRRAYGPMSNRFWKQPYPDCVRSRHVDSRHEVCQRGGPRPRRSRNGTRPRPIPRRIGTMSPDMSPPASTRQPA